MTLSLLSVSPVEKPGDRLGPYELVRLLGEGSIGRVFVGRHVKLGRQVAIKVLKPEHTANRVTLARFFNEARTVNQINHEHIVEVFDFVDEEAGAPVYCVMELLTGQTLSELLASGPVPMARSIRIASQVCEALSAAHGMGVVHRDLKPDNVFLIRKAAEADYVKVLDFGVAKMGGNSLAGASTSGTQEGAIVGTPTHMAPEQVVGLDVDARTDAYAMGTVLFQLFAGKLPFEEKDFGKLAMQIIKVPAPLLPERNTAGELIPEALRVLVSRCLAKEPEARPQTTAEIVRLLGECGRVPEAPVVVLPEPAPAPKSRVRLAAAAIGMAILVLGAAALVLSRSPEKPAPVVIAPVAVVAAATVTMTVFSTPTGATVVNVATGESLGVTPLRQTAPREDRELRLRISLPGFVAVERPARLSADVLLEVPLVAEAVVAAPIVAKPKKTSPSSKKKPGDKKGINANGIIDPFGN